jgi:hypothetical protein
MAAIGSISGTTGFLGYAIQEAIRHDAWMKRVTCAYGGNVARRIDTEAKLRAIQSGETSWWWRRELLTRHQAAASNAVS